jgi:hypothetical protein
MVKESFHFREPGLSMRATLADRFRIASCREWQKKFTLRDESWADQKPVYFLLTHSAQQGNLNVALASDTMCNHIVSIPR